ncbi:protein-tyrosine-phosphatase [Coemansia sp. RSA 1822]|nr:protein-tyrosine-phosphatase [Coemansia sp. RSA 638]KAJ2559668.1 protein-tyrosine-phosphatase [Coemansia sp. RSA 1822]
MALSLTATFRTGQLATRQPANWRAVSSATANARVQLVSGLLGVHQAQSLVPDLRLHIRALSCSAISNYRVPGGSGASMVGSSVNHSRGYSTKKNPSATLSQSELSRSIEKLGAERDWEGVWKLIDSAWTSTTTEPDTASMQQLIEYALAKKNGRQAVRLAQKLWTITSRNRLAANAVTDEWIDTVLCSAVSLTSGLASSKNHPFVDFTFALFLIDVTPGGPRLDREQSRVLQCANRLLAGNSVRGAAGIRAELNAVTAKYVVPLKTDSGQSVQSAQGPKWTRSCLKHGDKLLYPELKKWYIDAIARFEIPTIKNLSQLLTKAQKHGDHEFWETVVCQDFPKLMSALESTGLAKTDRLFKYYKQSVWSCAISTYASRKEIDKVEWLLELDEMREQDKLTRPFEGVFRLLQVFTETDEHLNMDKAEALIKDVDLPYSETQKSRYIQPENYLKLVWCYRMMVEGYLTVFQQQEELGAAYMTDSGIVKTKERIKFWLEKWKPKASEMNVADIIDPLIPPYRFERVQNRLYRGGYPKPRNFRFLRRQRLKTLVSLIPSDRDTQLSDYCRDENIDRICIPVDSPNENVTLTDEIVSQCLELMTDPSRAPLYIHCLDGSNVTGVVVMCLRKLQLWRVSSLQNEYLRFEQDGEIIPEESEFVETYTGKGLVLPNPTVPWLWPGRSCDDDKLPFKNGVHPVVPQTRIRARGSEICKAEPMCSLSRSATEPSLSECTSGSRNQHAESDTWSSSQLIGSEQQGAELDVLRMCHEQGSKDPEPRPELGALHVSISTSVLPELMPTHADRQTGDRKSRPQSEIHNVLEPVLAALADENALGKRMGALAEHDELSVASTIGHDPTEQAMPRGSDDTSSQTGDALLKLSDATDMPALATDGLRSGEIREIALSTLVQALGIEGLGM